MLRVQYCQEIWDRSGRKRNEIEDINNMKTIVFEANANEIKLYTD